MNTRLPNQPNPLPVPSKRDLRFRQLSGIESITKQITSYIDDNGINVKKQFGKLFIKIDNDTQLYITYEYR